MTTNNRLYLNTSKTVSKSYVRRCEIGVKSRPNVTPEALAPVSDTLTEIGVVLVAIVVVVESV